jgi:hypothetical protein
MSRARIFKALVVIAAACYLVWFLLPYTASDIEQRLAEYSGHGALLPIKHPLYNGVWFVLWIASAIGLIFLQNWARHLYLALSLLGLILAPFSGYVIQPPLDTMFASASTLLDGAILAMAYLSPLAEDFKRARQQP